MVGVPGRSKACATCRRRKKGCDLQRPVCTQCLRAGLECGGYERGRIFVHATQLQTPSLNSCEANCETACEANALSLGTEPVRHVNSSGLTVYRDPPTICLHPDPAGRVTRMSIVSRSKSSSSSSSSSSSYSSPFSPFSSSSTISSSSSSSPTDYRIVPVHTSRAHIVTNPRADKSLLASACEENILAAFWQLYLPNSTTFTVQAAGYASGGWTNVVQSLYRQDRVLHYTLMANCLSAVARQQGSSREMAELSLRAHGRALQALRHAISQPYKARSDTVFSALRLMIVFSMFFADRYDEDRMARAVGWKEHNMGVLALLLARRPEAHVTGYGHQMFVDFRLPLIVASLRSNKRSALNTLPWMTIPWSVIPKTPKDRLIDIMAGLPGIFENMEALKKLPPHNTVDRAGCRRKIVTMCWKYDRLLCAWYQASVPLGRLHALETGASNGPLSTEDLSLIYSMTIFSTACVLLYGVMEKLDIIDLPPRAELIPYVNKIGRYLKFFFHPSAGQYGLEMTSFPLGVCLQLIESKEKTMNMDAEKALFNGLTSTNRGHEIMEFLRSMMYVESINKN